jgi:CheY-like chemotaxis protein
MTSSTAPAGGDFLAHRHAVSTDLKKLPQLRQILVIEDETPDAKKLVATLNILFSYEATITQAATLGKAVDAVIAQRFDLVLLDDFLKPTDRAVHTIPFLRRAGYVGPIVVVSGILTPQRRLELMAAGADGGIHKDEVNSASLGVVLSEVFVGARGVAKAAE